MVRLQLSIKAELENITNLQPASDEFDYFFQVKCTSCNETHKKYVSVNRLDERDISNSKDTAHFVWRCELCNREATAKFDKADCAIPYNSENGLFQPFLVIDCRGLEFTDFDPRGIWKCETVGDKRTVFEVDLLAGDGEWNDYDENSALPVGVSGIESKWEKEKKPKNGSKNKRRQLTDVVAPV